MTHCKVHNVGFYLPEPRAIYCFALNKRREKLALSRSDASVEIWNLKYAPFMEKCVPPSLENFSIEGLCWAGDRLFSVGLHGCVFEYDLYRMRSKSKWIVTGEAATCLDVNKSNTLLAVGTELGYINLFGICEDGLDFDRFLDKQEGRIVCIRFDHSGEFLVTGSLNAVRVWNVSSGHAIHKMQLGRSEAKKETVVWCLEISSDFTVFTGDSRGILTLWDGRMGAQIEQYQSHKADILSACLSEDEDCLYCAGVDPLITSYMKITVKEGVTKWVKSVHRKIHEHDVRAMALLGKKLYTGGMDSYLTCSYHPPKTLIKFPPLIYGRCVHVASQARRILLRYPTRVELWSLGETEPADDTYRGLLELKSKCKKLVAVQRMGRNWNDEYEGEGVVCCAISDDGRWILVSTHLGFRLYRFSVEDGVPELIKMDDLKGGEDPCVQAVFVGEQLVCALSVGTLAVYDLTDEEVSLAQTIDHRDELSDTVTFLGASSCGKYLVAADGGGNVTIWTKRNREWRNYSRLPRYEVPPTALAVHPVTLNLVVAYADGKVIEYSVKKKQLTRFSLRLAEDVPQWRARGGAVRNITFDPRKKNVLLLHDEANIAVANKERRTPSEDAEPSPKKASNRNQGAEPDVRVVQKYKHLVHLERVVDEQYLAVEVNPLAILEKLPPAFAQKTFGTK
ncbi:U3 small nucleolar RNA-associated protein 4 homolog [Cylas formicarius]|uniref:U3 small nucleolar RNA-associated protein 4 homolog n=1 Tax=Cylas formicarius TaxID=197179 RepID=UPI002958A0CC|nr:U3 small nucleolar RNA-associated protein 4 homolog [Cylas formicarius]